MIFSQYKIYSGLTTEEQYNTFQHTEIPILAQNQGNVCMTITDMNDLMAHG